MAVVRGSKARSLVWRLGGLASIRVASAVTPLLALPIVARHATSPEWAALGVGTSLGTVGAVMVGLGWYMTGPPRVAGHGWQVSAEVLQESRTSSLLTFYVVTPLIAFLGALVGPPEARGLTAATAAAVTASGLSVAWHITARGMTRQLMTYEVTPRLVAVCSSAALVGIAGRSMIWTYPLALGMAALAGPLLYARVHRPGRALSPAPRMSGVALARRQTTPALTAVLGSAYSGLALTLIALVTTTDEVAGASSAFRIYLISLSAIMVVNQATIHWAVAGVGPSHRELRIAGALYLGVATTGLTCFATLGPWLGRLLFHDQQPFDVATSAALGAAFAALTIHTFVNTHLLLPFGLTAAGFRATATGAVVGVPSTLLLADVWGASGGAIGVAVAEAVVAVVLIAAHRRARIGAERTTTR